MGLTLVGVPWVCRGSLGASWVMGALWAHPPSPSSSEIEPEEEEFESKTDGSDESFPALADPESESDETESEDVAVLILEAVSAPAPITDPISSPRMKGVPFKTQSPLFCYNDNVFLLKTCLRDM
uniref:Uncharacterized protein n=1 Tax=Cannabis sativa TaxID=3483 RepID=A0A803NNA7_CANSA